MGKIIAIVVGVLVLLVGGYMYMQQNSQVPANAQANQVPAVSETAMPEMPATDTSVAPTAATAGAVKEFTMTAFYDEKGVWFSLKNIDVKKGDTVRIKATNTKGMHDFSLDEYGIKKELPLNQEVVIEFVADKVGEFQYYCSKPGHRAKGQWGTLKVTE